MCIPSKTLIYVCLGVHINQKRVWGNNHVLLTECLFQHLYLFLFLACRCVLQNKGCVHRIVLKLKGKNISFKEDVCVSVDEASDGAEQLSNLITAQTFRG